MRAMLAIVAWTAVARAQPAVETNPAASVNVEVVGRPCTPQWYLEPSLLFVVGSATPGPVYVGLPRNAGEPLGRVALGGLIRWCDGKRDVTHLRIGVTAYLSGLRDATGNSHGDGGAGFEAQYDRPITARLRLGGRVGVETAATATALLTAGVRVHLDDSLWLGIDAFRMPAKSDLVNCSEYATYMCRTSATGAMLGLGLEGHNGKVISAVELGVLAIVGAVLAGESASQGFHL